MLFYIFLKCKSPIYLSFDGEGEARNDMFKCFIFMLITYFLMLVFLCEKILKKTQIFVHRNVLRWIIIHLDSSKLINKWI